MSITVLAVVFGLVTLAALAAVAWRFRRLPIVALIAARERDLAFHRDALAGLEAAIAAARAEGRDTEAARLAPHLAGHRARLAALAQGAEFAGSRR